MVAAGTEGHGRPTARSRSAARSGRAGRDHQGDGRRADRRGARARRRIRCRGPRRSSRTPTAPCRPAGSTPSAGKFSVDDARRPEGAEEGARQHDLQAHPRLHRPGRLVELHVRGRRARRRPSAGRWRDIGITAQRYSLVLYGNAQQLKLEPWEPEIAAHGHGAVRVEGRHLVSPEAARREHCRTARCGRAARRGRPASPSRRRG